MSFCWLFVGQSRGHVLESLTECLCTNEAFNGWRCAQVKFTPWGTTLFSMKSNQAKVDECDILSREHSVLLSYWLGITYVMCVCVCQSPFRFISLILGQLKAEMLPCSSTTFSLPKEGPNFSNEMIFIVYHKTFISLLDNVSLRCYVTTFIQM